MLDRQHYEDGLSRLKNQDTLIVVILLLAFLSELFGAWAPTIFGLGACIGIIVMSHWLRWRSEDAARAQYATAQMAIAEQDLATAEQDLARAKQDLIVARNEIQAMQIARATLIHTKEVVAKT